jgi:hypothetical protein
MIDVEHGALRAFEHDVGVPCTQVGEHLRDVRHQRFHAIRVRQLLVQRLLEVDWRLLEILLQREVVEVEYLAELGSVPIRAKRPHLRLSACYTFFELLMARG